MAYDEHTADRFRTELTGMVGISEKRMMGGVCFLLNGNMIGGADCSKDGVRRFMFRLGKGNHTEGEGMPGAIPMIQGDRTMRGFFWVDEEDCTDEVLRNWVSLSLSLAASLPEK